MVRMIEAILQNLIQTRSGERQARLAHDAAPVLVRAPDTPAGLVQALTAGVHREAVFMLLADCLDHGRMARENRQTGGAAFLDQIAIRLAGAARQGALDAETLVGVASCYARAGLETPAALVVPVPRARPGAATGVPGRGKQASDDAAMELDAIIGRMVGEAGAEPLQLHSLLADMLAALSPPVRGFAVHRLASRGTATFDKLACYWLLDASAETRRSAAQALTDRARQGSLPPALVADLQRLIPWLPDIRERDVLAGIGARADEIVMPADEAGAGGENAPPRDTGAKPGGKSSYKVSRKGKHDTRATATWRVEAVMISMPDGAGCQNLALSAQRGRERAIALCLLKRGHGVKDAFIIPCKSKAEQRRIIDEMDFAVPLLPVTPGFALQSLGRALADGIAAGALPSPGLLDVADLTGTPVPMIVDTRALLAALGPATQQLLTSKAKIANLAGQQSETIWDDALFDSWFEQTEGLDNRLAGAATLKAATGVVWEALAERRLWWAEQLAISATVADASPALTPFASACMAAAAHSLLGSVSMRKLAVMEAVVQATLQAYAGRDVENDRETGPEWITGTGSLSGADEALAAAGLTLPFLEGWGVAMAAAPRPPSPEQALGGILERLIGNPVGDFQTVLLRVNDGLMAAMDGAADPGALAARLCKFSAADCMAWCTGFEALVAQTKQNWPRTRLGTEGRELLELTASGATAALDLVQRARAAQLAAAMVMRRS
jgi:hypothetical protein